MKTQTKIIATVGLPDKKPYANKLAEEGADIIRVNTKYGSEKDWTNIINKVKKTKSKILIDIPSPKSKNHQQPTSQKKTSEKLTIMEKYIVYLYLMGH